jgi:hypothetical protein
MPSIAIIADTGNRDSRPGNMDCSPTALEVTQTARISKIWLKEAIFLEKFASKRVIT